MNIEVCLSPALFSTYFDDPNCRVVVIDVFRATSAMCAAFHVGVEKIFPVLDVEEAKEYQNKGILAAAERNGEVVAGFDYGNSPLAFLNANLKGKELALTTTNGTKALLMASAANEVLIGSFLNLSAITNYLNQNSEDIILFCAGWKDRFNLEDTLFAGAVVEQLSHLNNEIVLSDSALASQSLYNNYKSDLIGFLANASHMKRLSRLNLEEDIKYCLKESCIDLVPIFKGNYISVL